MAKELGAQADRAPATGEHWRSSLIARLADNSGVFDQEAIDAMAKAFEIGCGVLKGRPKPEVDEERLAQLIIQVAREGIRDPAQLCANALNAIIPPRN